MGNQSKRAARRKDRLKRLELAADAAARIQEPRFDGAGKFVLSSAVEEYGHRVAPYEVQRTPDGPVFLFKPSANMVDVELPDSDDEDVDDESIAVTIAPYMVDPSQAEAFVGDSFTMNEFNTLLEGLYGVTPQRAGKQPGSAS